MIYDELIHHIGEVKARVYYEANRDALTFIRNTVHENRISCDLVDEYAYIYTTSKQNIAKIDKEWNAYEKLGIPGKRTDRIPLPLDASTAIVMSNQARFHPVVYLTPMMNDFINNGGHIFEETTAMTVEHASPLSKVVTKDGYKVACRDVVSCSHFPFYGAGGFYFARMYAERSYALGVKSNMDPVGMYLSADDPPRSIRYVSYHGEDLILVGGERHKTGQGIYTFKHYEALEAFVGEKLGRCEIPYRWSAQDFTTLDKIPYIGRVVNKEQHAFIVTGFRKWGVTIGTAAAILLKDMILGIENRYEELYTPSRFYADPGVKAFLTTNAERAGAYREPNGTLHVLDTTCTHMDCEVEWNAGERTWDCPCHGSRFSFSGEVLEGPAKKAMKVIDY